MDRGGTRQLTDAACARMEPVLPPTGRRVGSDGSSAGSTRRDVPRCGAGPALADRDPDAGGSRSATVWRGDQPLIRL